MVLIGVYYNEFKKADNGSRTHDLLLTRQMLYQLSYTGYGTLLTELHHKYQNSPKVEQWRE